MKSSRGHTLIRLSYVQITSSNLVDVVVVGGGPWSPDTNFPTHHTARRLSREHRVLYLYRGSHASLLGHAAGRLRSFHSTAELATAVLAGPRVYQVAERLWVAPLTGAAAALPLSYPPAIRAISVRFVTHQLRHFLRELQFTRPLLWFYWWFFPEIARAIPHELAVYDIYDDHSEYDYVRINLRRKRYTTLIERNLLGEVDLAFAVSHKLVRERSGLAPIHYLPNGVDLVVAESAKRAALPHELSGLPRPIAGYLGSYDSRLDWDLVDAMALARPNWSFVFVGGGETEPLRPAPNVHLLGNRPYPEALRYVNGFDLALIPFVLDELTAAVCPAKLFDYLALGKPILSTPLPAVSEVVGPSDAVYTGTTADALLQLAEHALREDPALPRLRMEIAAGLTWERRSQQAMRWIEEALAQHATASVGLREPQRTRRA